MTTLADLTPEELANCPGMWAQTQDELGVLLTTDGVLGAVWIPHAFNWLTQPLEAIELLTDLPRAWQADGTPPAGEWQTGKVKIIPNGNAKYDPALNVITGDAVVDPDHEPREAHDIRRWIGEWKTIEEEQA